jgi:hypothetical protein
VFVVDLVEATELGRRAVGSVLVETEMTAFSLFGSGRGFGAPEVAVEDVRGRVEVGVRGCVGVLVSDGRAAVAVEMADELDR